MAGKVLGQTNVVACNDVNTRDYWATTLPGADPRGRAE